MWNLIEGGNMWASQLNYIGMASIGILIQFSLMPRDTTETDKAFVSPVLVMLRIVQLNLCDQCLLCH